MRYEDIPRDFNITAHFLDGRLQTPGGGARTALITGDGPVSYAELAAKANRVGNVLAELGVAQGDRVLIALSDGVEFVATWYGAQKIGAVTGEVYSFLQVKDYRYFLEYAEPAVVVAGAATLAVRKRASQRARVRTGRG